MTIRAGTLIGRKDQGFKPIIVSLKIATLMLVTNVENEMR